MPGRETEIYRRGKYWLDWDRAKDGTLRSPNLTIFWYDAATGRIRSASTRTTEEDEAIKALDLRWLRDRGEAPAFCPTCGQPLAQGSVYLLADAIADYRLEIGDARESGATIASRLSHVTDYLEAANLVGATCADAALASFVDKFRAWSRLQPVVFRNGDGVVTVSRPRAPATTEASVAQLAAALNHAFDEGRSDKAPKWKAKTAKQVNRVRRTRTGVEVLADMLAYAAEPNKRRGALHAFIIGSICTLARPISIYGISTDPARHQWRPSWNVIDLNPAGRVQNKKRRPTLPVLPLLREWLLTTLADTNAEKSRDRTGGWLVNYYGRRVRDVDSAWDAMLDSLDLPREREWKSYLLRHSISTLVRAAGVPKWELEAFMGHSDSSQTETYAVEVDFPNVLHALQHLIDDLDRRAPGALHRRNTGARGLVIPIGATKMT